ncbi:histone family protein [Methanosphaera sp. ISO3-F5]|uniref:histone family protein n=1 Tax=Methanosphaera sp. ISO3-F5 TaxID=1452353 RepID=UPI002B25E529|nr:histone family protein [Methanosphaera sp. ISO3-F5]WQH64728.1 histone family protein [Methanosphaera sp. ISO3-F5]
MTELPIAPIKRILKNSGAARVSDEAAVELAGALEEVGESLAIRAYQFAKHAGRKTIKAEDIVLAAKE